MAYTTVYTKLLPIIRHFVLRSYAKSIQFEDDCKIFIPADQWVSWYWDRGLYTLWVSKWDGTDSAGGLAMPSSVSER